MSALAVLDHGIRVTQKYLTKARKNVDDDARRRGHRIAGADFHCAWLEHVLAHQKKTRDAFAKLLSASTVAQTVLADRWFQGDRNDDDVIEADEKLQSAIASATGEKP